LSMDHFGQKAVIQVTLILLGLSICTVARAYATPAPPLEEIRGIIAQRCLWIPSSSALKALNEKNLQAGLQEIDPNARYVSPSSFSSFVASTSTRRIGADIFLYNTHLWIRPESGGPADRAGLPEIGVLQAINANKISDQDFNHAIAVLDSKLISREVVLTVSGCPGIRGKTYRVRPAQYIAPSVIWHRTDGYMVIRIREFISHDTASSLSALYKTIIQTQSRVILDLRGCSGGDLLEAIEVAGMFVPQNRVMLRTYTRSGLAQTYRSPPNLKSTAPLWILIDHRTASSAEILAGVLHFYRLGKLVGEKSYGKCTSQISVPLSNGGGLWLTNLMIRFPDKNACSGALLRPDILIPGITISTLSDIIRKAS
jgi:carboxyl-terminal processing protease